MKSTFKLLLVFSMLLSLISCGEDADVLKIRDDTAQVARQIDDLNRALSRRELTNAMILAQYIRAFKTQKPEFAELADKFAESIKPGNPAIEAFKQRLKVVQDNPESLGDNRAVIQELSALSFGTGKDMYNDSLLDVINTIADLSDGKLARIGAPQKSAGDTGAASASQLVGNPQYGHWQTNSGGQSFWAWYGQYALISSLLGGNRYRYNDWSYNRGWSHYNDYGRSRYASQRQRNSYRDFQKKNEPALKQYGKKTGRSQSSYAAKRSNPVYANKVQARKIKAARSARYKSQYAGSMRSSSRSRSSFGGK